ncbi:MAG: prepilin-type N-terminal cleavage/methylation domain-containing protein [Solirubrobacteraceae bacterium]
MLHKLRQRAQDEKGFTLIELLVVILIIGILAAIAIPSFLNQRTKASDAQAKEMARTAQTAAETYATDHNGSYSGLSSAVLTGVEPSLSDTSGARFSTAAADVSFSGYSVVANSTDNNSFTITRSDSGVISRTCTAAASPNSGGCVGGSW